MVIKNLIPKGLKKDALKYLFVAIGVFLLLLVFLKFKSVFLTIFLVILGIVSVLWKRFIRVSLGFELITFVTIVLCFGINPVFAFFAATIMVIVGSFISGRVCIPMFVKIGAYGVVCLVSALFLGSNIVVRGIVLALINNLVLHFCYIFVFGFSPANSALDFALNMMLNFFLFTRFGQIVGLF
ncbi:MAG: hypothetical protein MAG795_00311 [Candidatus Woesearchaeota archaeon]|nr:hypothetical protein [Candidatus Woesearchaeota archaeon]